MKNFFNSISKAKFSTIEIFSVMVGALVGCEGNDLIGLAIMFVGFAVNGFISVRISASIKVTKTEGEK